MIVTKGKYMPMEKLITTENLIFYPLTIERWDDFTDLFGPHGCGGCWCMFWRIRHKDFAGKTGQDTKNAMKDTLKKGIIPGILGYNHGKAVTWCSVSPREDFLALEYSRKFKRVDDQAVWSIVCFFIDKTIRNAGLMEKTIQSAVEYARRQGAKIIEAYPIKPAGHRHPTELYMGSLNAFTKAGFQQVEKRGAHIIVRYEI
jgi:GNAT superfamily N-acetyltransferase